MTYKVTLYVVMYDTGTKSLYPIVRRVEADSPEEAVEKAKKTVSYNVMQTDVEED